VLRASTSSPQRDTLRVVREPGLLSTVNLRALLSRPAAAPGDRVSLRVAGPDAASLGRGKVLYFEQERDGGWQYAGTVVTARASDRPSRWAPVNAAPFAVTLEAYPATMPLYFDVPPVDPGVYRIRLDAIAPDGRIGDLRRRTATFYVALRVLPSQ
jgi:hypothetical protein